MSNKSALKTEPPEFNFGKKYPLSSALSKLILKLHNKK
jgi:hypothetical protein